MTKGHKRGKGREERRSSPEQPSSSGGREVVFQPEFIEDLRYWVETERRTALRVLDLVEAILRDPFRGLGKPEPLKYLGAGVWARRLTGRNVRCGVGCRFGERGVSCSAPG